MDYKELTLLWSFYFFKVCINSSAETRVCSPVSIFLSGTNEEKLVTLKEVLAGSEVGQKGVEESEFILKTLSVFGLKNELELDLTLARGLNYYTGAIFEVKALDVQIGSITGGGRYEILPVYSAWQEFPV